MSRRRRIGLAVAVAVGLVAVGVVVAMRPRGATPVSEQDALTEFRERSDSKRDAGAEGDAVDGARPLRPEPGVYRYAASGQEVVKVGVLPADERAMPEVVTAVLVDDGDCFVLTVNFMAQHTEDTTYCTDASGSVRLEHNVKHQQVGPLTAEAEMVCEPPVTLSPTGQGRSDLTCRLRMSTAAVTLGSTLTGTQTVSPPETLTIGDRDVEAVSVVVEHVVTGDMSGRTRESLWLDTTNWLPVRIERDMELTGFATFTERSRLDLQDLTPLR